MAVVAALFDSDADASAALDRLLNNDRFKDVETRVVTPGTSNPTTGTVFPVVPMTGSGEGTPGAWAPVGIIGGGVFGDWFGNTDEAEQNFYQDAMREGSTLAMVAVDDDDEAVEVRRLLSSYGARTYLDD